MRALVNTGPGRLELQAWPLPTPRAGQVRIKTLACGICSTDLHMIAGWQRTGFPAIPGHEWSGVVDAVGKGVDPRMVGERCVAENVLADGGEVGFEHPGGYGEFLVTEARNLHLLPPDFSPALGALIEPLAVCMHALHRLRLENQNSALIFGDGVIGLLLLLLLKQLGVEQVALVGGFAYRLALAEKLGASPVIDFHHLGADSKTELNRLTGKTFSTIFEASGSGSALQMAMREAGHGAQILVLGDYGGDRADFLWNDLLHQEFELIGSNASAGAWSEAVRLAVTGRLPMDRLVTHRFPIERFEEGFELAANQKNACVKVLLEWPQ
jgi:2-desacetyl-2-hydroxyethyl bacteriochlorophyllide A dehydrogenase